MIAALPAHRAVADDETHDTEIKIQAVLDTVDCAAQTLSVLGLAIDISAATIDTQSGTTPTPSPSPSPSPTADDKPGSVGIDTGGGGGGHVTSATPSNGCYYYCLPTPPSPQNPTPGTTGCAALVAGQPVEVKLTSDQTPLAATEVTQNGTSEEFTIQAPIQGVDANTQTITVLGLAIDVSGSGLDGADDSGDSSQPIDLGQLITGQFVEVRLASGTPPLTATETEVKNFANQADVQVEDADQSTIDDTDASGNRIDDVEVDATATVGLRNPAGLVHKSLQFHTSSNGSFNLAGLPTGLVRIQVTRVHNDIRQVGRRTLRVKPNTSRHVRLRLRTAP